MSKPEMLVNVISWGSMQKSSKVRSLLRSIYQTVHSSLPDWMAEPLSDAAFRVANRPLVYHDAGRHPGGGLLRGAVTFSIDFEMAWATQYSRNMNEDCVSIGLRERAQVPEILAKFNQYGIPATWATVGHLFLRRCVRDSRGLAHPEMPRVQHFDGHWKFTSGDWYQHDPCSDFTKDPAWYAPDLVESILMSRTAHEVACHGFSHVGFGPYCSKEVLAAELDACIEAMKAFNLTPRSLVFPGNEVGEFELIAQKGFLNVRAFPETWPEITLPVHLLDGLWGVHGSVSVDTDSRAVNLGKRLVRLKKYLDRAIETKMAAHIWLHPSLPAVQMRELLFPLLEYCASLRDRGLLDVFTMDQLVSATKEELRKEGRA